MNTLKVNGEKIKPHNKVHRVAHCFMCKQKLDNKLDRECVECNWIRCKCGACGCNFGF